MGSNPEGKVTEEERKVEKKKRRRRRRRSVLAPSGQTRSCVRVQTRRRRRGGLQRVGLRRSSSGSQFKARRHSAGLSGMFLHDHIQAGPHPLTRTDTEAAAHWAAAEQGAGSRRSLPTPLRGPGLGDTPVFLEETPAVCKTLTSCVGSQSFHQKSRIPLRHLKFKLR